MLRPFLSYVSCPDADQPDVELIDSGKQASSVSNYIYTYLCLKKERKKNWHPKILLISEKEGEILRNYKTPVELRVGAVCQANLTINTCDPVLKRLTTS